MHSIPCFINICLPPIYRFLCITYIQFRNILFNPLWFLNLRFILFCIFLQDLDSCVSRMRTARQQRLSLAIGYHGNVVDLWERLATERDLLVDIGYANHFVKPYFT